MTQLFRELVKKSNKKVAQRLGGFNEITTFALAIENKAVAYAEVAQLVEHNLAKVRVAGSSPVFRSFSY